jgi:hypothetical protein
MSFPWWLNYLSAVEWEGGQLIGEKVYTVTLCLRVLVIYIKLQTWKFYILCAYNRQHQSGYMLFLGVFGRLLVMCHKNILPQFMSQRTVCEFAFCSYKLKEEK